MKMEKRVIELAIYADREFIKSATIEHYPDFKLDGYDEKNLREIVADTVHYGLLEGGGHNIEHVWKRYRLYPDAYNWEHEPYDADYILTLVDYTATVVYRAVYAVLDGMTC